MAFANGVPQDVLKPDASEHDQVKNKEIAALQRQLTDLQTAVFQSRPRYETSPDDLKAELVQMRSEFRTALASILAPSGDGGGELPEMQLSALRRQVAQLEGALESNYGRELRAAEERELALRSEMAQMRQDLRVALETLYRIPESTAPDSAHPEVEDLREQLSQLTASFARATHEQERAAIERETALLAEIGHMRRDLLVTLEASYQLPGDRADGLLAQIESWQHDVKQLQQSMEQTQQSLQEQARLARESAAQELAAMQRRVEDAMDAMATRSREAQASQVAAATQHFETVEARMAADVATRLDGVERTVAGMSSQLQTAMSSIGEGLQTALSTGLAHSTAELTGRFEERAASLVDRLELRLTTVSDEMRAAIAECLAQESSRIQERSIASARELTEKLDAVHATLTDLHDRPVEAGIRAGDLEPLHSAVAQHAAALEAVRASIDETVAQALGQHEQLREFVTSQAQATNGDIASMREAILEALLAQADADTVTPLTLADIEAALGDAIAHLRDDSNRQQTEQYRQLVSQVAQLQLDIDGISTELVSLQPSVDSDSIGFVSEAQMSELLEAIRSPRHSESPSSEEAVFALRTVVERLSADLQRELESLPVRLNPIEGATAPGIEEVVRSAVAEREAAWLSALDQSTNQTAVLHAELLELRGEIDAALHRPTTGADVAADGEPAQQLRADIEELRSQMVALGEAQQTAVRDAVVHIRDDMQRSIESFRADRAGVDSGTAGASEMTDDRLAALSTAVQRLESQLATEHAERDAYFRAELGELRATMLQSVSSTEDQTRQQSVQLSEDLQALKRELAAMQERRGDDMASMPVRADDVAALRSQLDAVLEAVHGQREAPEPHGFQNQEQLWEELTGLAATVRADVERQEAVITSQAEALSAAVAQMREEMHAALQGLTRESVDAFEKRQTQLRMEQLEMERNLANLRQELIASRAEGNSKRKGWR
jgi:hypothetical protein